MDFEKAFFFIQTKESFLILGELFMSMAASIIFFQVYVNGKRFTSSSAQIAVKWALYLSLPNRKFCSEAITTARYCCR